MANFMYTPAKSRLLSGDLDLNAHDIRVAIVMTNTTADTEQDASVMDDFTTLDEYDGSGYARQALAGEAVNTDAANNRGEFDANDIQFAALGAGTRQAAALLVYRHVDGTDPNDQPIAYIDTTSPSVFPFAGNGGDVDVAWNAEGILQLT
jgi:hypothetical protein